MLHVGQQQGAGQSPPDGLLQIKATAVRSDVPMIVLSRMMISQAAKLVSEPSQRMSFVSLSEPGGPGKGEDWPTRSWAPASKPRERHATCSPRRPRSLYKITLHMPLIRTSRRPYSHAPPSSALPPTSRAKPLPCPAHHPH